MKRDTDQLGSIAGKRTKGRQLLEPQVSGAPVKWTPVRRALLLAAVLGVVFIAYSNSFNSLFLLDNDPIILKDSRIRSVTSDHVERILHGEYWPLGMSGLYRPVTTFSFMFNYSILGNGTDPSGYHWLNLALHMVNVGLVYLLGLVIFEQLPCALLLAALWGIHPVLTESVTNIVGRADLLSALGVLGALHAHRKSLQTSGSRRVLWIATVALAVLIGMFSKEATIVVLAVLVIYDLSFGRAGSWTSRVPSYIAALVPCLVFLYARSQVLAGAASTAFPFGDNPLVGASFWISRMTAFKVIGRYLGLLSWPRWLSYDYSFNENPLFGGSIGNWEDLKAVLSLLLCLVAGALAVFCYRNRKPVFFAIAFFFATLAPTSNLIIQIGSIMAERFLYLPSIGFLILAVYCGRNLAQRLTSRWPAYRNAVPAALAILLIALTGRTYARNADWVDQGRFWRRGVEAAPNSYKTNLTAANNTVFINRQDWETAIMQVNRALAILDPVPDLQNSGTAYQHAGTFYRNLGLSLEEAQPTGQGRIDAQPWYQKSRDALLRSERIEVAQDAVTRAENAKRGKPSLTFVPSALYLQLGRTYEKLGEPQKALAAFERGRELESDPNLLVDLADEYRRAGEPRKAVMALMEALAVDSSRTKLLPDIVQLYSEIDPSGCAISRDGGTPVPNWECPLVHGDICTASRNVSMSYLHTAQLKEAAAIRTIAIQELGCSAALLQ